MSNLPGYNKDFSTEFTFSASRSGGAGGQNVNKVNTKVELRFSIPNSHILTDREKAIVIEKLANRITADGELIIVSQVERSQLGNKLRCIEKFYELINQALTPRKKRKPTKPTKASQAKRVDKKRQRSVKKELRKKPNI
ncbi:MAG: alternative ribosome rescue aminoacyl-tRNA hydrolase ArfB [Bacteroidales bacterium]|jgi:ribosome-associated protein|nr:alternative ribosome rescue aminoacyl-tRNA hydrolase ArfB [Bacteroidales bacterium]